MKKRNGASEEKNTKNRERNWILFFLVCFLLSNVMGFTILAVFLSTAGNHETTMRWIMNDIDAAEIGFYENDSPALIEAVGKTRPEFNLEQYERIEVLDSAALGLFIEELSNTEIISLSSGTEPKSANSPVGYALILKENDGNKIVLSTCTINGIAYDLISRFDSRYRHIEHFGNFADRAAFTSILDKNFNSFPRESSTSR